MIVFLQLESQLQQDEMQLKSHDSKLILVHENPLFEDNNNDNTYFIKFGIK